MYVSFQISVLVFFGYIARSGIARSYGSFLFSFLRNLHTIFYSGCTNLHSPPTVYKLFFFFTSLPTFVICVLFDDSHSDRCEAISTVVLICISLMISSVEHSFMCLLAICIFLWKNVCSVLLPILKSGSLFFWCWVTWTIYGCCILIPYWLFHLKISFFPIH